MSFFDYSLFLLYFVYIDFSILNCLDPRIIISHQTVSQNVKEYTKFLNNVFLILISSTFSLQSRKTEDNF